VSGADTIEATPGLVERRRVERLGAWLRNPALLGLAAAVAASGTLLIALAGHDIFLNDEWAVTLYRRGLSVGTFLDPHGDHLAASVIAFYKLVLATFGMTSPLPFHIGATIAYLTAAVLLFAYARQRVGDWLALMATIVILFFGASSVDLLAPFQIFFSGSIAAGLAALLALDRDDRRGDAIACVLLVVSTSFSEVGLAFSIGALARVALGRRPLFPRLYMPLVPLGLYAIWWLGWGHTGHSYVTLHNIATTPAYVLRAAGAAVASLLGLASASDALPGPVGQQWIAPVLVAGVALAVWRVRRIGAVPRGVWPVLLAGLTFWSLAGFSYLPSFREPGNGRYLYPSAIFVLLIAIELMRGVRLGWRGILAVAAVTAISVAANLVFLKDGYRYFLEPASEIERGAVTALEIAGPERPSFVLTSNVSPVTFYDINTRSYLSAVRAWGSPAYTQTELASAPEDSRVEADKVLGAMLGLDLKPGGNAAASCRTVRASPTGSTPVELGPGRTTLRAPAGARAKVSLGRFSDELPVDAGTLRPASTASLTIAADRSAQPWRLGLEGHGQVRICASRTTG
jgi:hypothetical protein